MGFIWTSFTCSMNTDMIDLKDVTFLFAFRIDSNDRLENLFVTLKYLSRHFDTNFHLIEAGPNKTIDEVVLRNISDQIVYSYISDEHRYLHRTFYNNLLIRNSDTPYFFLYDADIILPPVQIMESVKFMRSGSYTAIYPYDGSFYEVDKMVKKIFIQRNLIGTLEKFMKYHRLFFRNSYGGVVLLNKSLYGKCGFENINIKGWGPDDVERVRRIRIFGFAVLRIKGPLFHLYHERTQTSDALFNQSNQLEYLKICSLTRNELRKYLL
jgi:hypothetical protein